MGLSNFAVIWEGLRKGGGGVKNHGVISLGTGKVGRGFVNKGAGRGEAAQRKAGCGWAGRGGWVVAGTRCKRWVVGLVGIFSQFERV